MKILALEFSSERRSVAVRDASLPEAARRLGQSEEVGGRGARGFALVEEALRQAGMEREEIERIAVGLGPGSFTGVRLAISLAQGWQLARNVGIVGVSTIECLMEQALRSGLRGRVNAVVDAQRGEFHLVRCEFEHNRGKICEPLRLATRAEVQTRIDAGELVIGPEASRWFPGARSMHPLAMTVAELAEGRQELVAGESLNPLSLRETRYVKAPPPRVPPAI